MCLRGLPPADSSCAHWACVTPQKMTWHRGTTFLSRTMQPCSWCRETAIIEMDTFSGRTRPRPHMVQHMVQPLSLFCTWSTTWSSTWSLPCRPAARGPTRGPKHGPAPVTLPHAVQRMVQNMVHHLSPCGLSSNFAERGPQLGWTYGWTIDRGQCTRLCERQRLPMVGPCTRLCGNCSVFLWLDHRKTI